MRLSDVGDKLTKQLLCASASVYQSAQLSWDDRNTGSSYEIYFDSCSSKETDPL